MKALIVMEVEVEDGPYDPENAPAEAVHSIDHYLWEAYGKQDDRLEHNAMRVVGARHIVVEHFDVRLVEAVGA